MKYRITEYVLAALGAVLLALVIIATQGEP